MRGHDFANDNLDSFVNATADAALAMGGFVAAAEAAGLGCCPISLVRNHIEAVEHGSFCNTSLHKNATLKGGFGGQIAKAFPGTM